MCVLGFANIRSSHPEVLFAKVILKICSKFTGEHPCRSVISIKLLCNFIEITLRHGCSPVNLLHTFRTHFPRNTSGWLLLLIYCNSSANIFFLYDFLPRIYLMITEVGADTNFTCCIFAYVFTNRRSLQQVFSFEFCGFFQNIFSVEHQ